MNTPPHNSNINRHIFTRYAKALGVSRGNHAGAIAFTEGQKWTNTGPIVQSFKSAQTAMGTSDMVPPTPAEVAFAEYIRPLTILGKLTGLRRAPSRTRLIAATAGSTASWAGERAPRPISRMTFAGETIEQLSVISVLVTTAELLRSSDPAAEETLSRDLANSAVQAMDEAFIDPANAGIAGVKPASITHGVTAIHSAGNTLAAIDSDLAFLIEALSDAGSDLAYATFILRPRTALYLSLLRGTGGALAYPGMTVKGGILAGLPAIVSAASPSSVGSPAEGGSITLLDPSQVLVCDDNGGAIEISRQSTIQLEDAPGTGATQLVSLWQTDSAALKMTRYVNWKRCRDGMAQVLDQVTY